MCLSAKLGLPQLREQLAVGNDRITSVNPPPTKAAQALYAEADDDTEAISLFMEAQSMPPRSCIAGKSSTF